MGLGHSPQIVTRNLLLNLDFGNVQKCYNGSENLLPYSIVSTTTWGSIVGSTVTNNATTAPDGTNTAARIQVNTGGYVAVLNNTVTPGRPYTFSFWVKSFSGSSGTWGINWFEAITGHNRTTVNITGEWQRVSITFTPTQNQINVYISDDRSLLGTILDGYVWGAQLEIGSSASPLFITNGTTRTRPTTATSTISNYSHTINQSQYISYDATTNSIRFDRNETFASFTGSITGSVLDVSAMSGINTIRVGAAVSFSGRSANALYITSLGTGIGTTGTYNLNVGTATTTSRPMTAAIKEGGNIRIDTSGLLASNTYLYNDHTTEVWARINDRNPSNYDLTEGDSGLFMFVGFHTMFLYNLSGLTYYVWSSTGPAVFSTSYLTIGTSGTDIIQGQWFHVVVTKTGSTYRTYLNGTLRKTDTISATAYSAVSNILKLGSGYESNTGIYNVYGKNNVGCVKMYNTALTADEISQNFNALRGRFGI